MKETLERLSQIKAPVCVSLVLNTHKTRPENAKDSIHLKNLISEANTRLKQEFNDDIAKRYTEKLNEMAEHIDHNHNDLGLMMFVNDEVAEYLRIPMQVHDRVVIDETFATRPIVRALQKHSDYYVLALSKGKARFFQFSGDEAVKEFKENGFPHNDNALLSTIKSEGGNATKVSRLTREFFNNIDKKVNEIRNLNPLPVVVYAEKTNFHQYLNEADYPNTILGHIVLQNFDEKPGNLAKEIGPQIERLTIESNRERIEELEQALGAGKTLSDLNDIWRAVREGRGNTIFVEEGYIQPVRDEDGMLTPIETADISHSSDIDDIVDEMIEHTLKFGGDVVFIEKGGLEKFNQLALVTRY